MSKEQDNKAIVGRWFTSFWGSTCDLAIVDEIAAPDIDDQLAQARSNLELAKANLKYAQANAHLAQVDLTRFQASPFRTVKKFSKILSENGSGCRSTK